jgi:ectoine hydroxylase
MFIPRSQHGTLAAGHDLATTSYPLWTLDNETVTRLAAEATRRRAALASSRRPASRARC